MSEPDEPGDEAGSLDDVRPFAPLDPEQSQPHEVPRAGRRGLQFYRVDLDRRRLTRRELVAILFLPSLFVLLLLLGRAKAGPAVAIVAVLLLVVGMTVFALSGRRR